MRYVRGVISVKIGARIYVSTTMFEGWAEITGFEPCVFYPIVITLEEGDSDGHKYHRININDITEESIK